MGLRLVWCFDLCFTLLYCLWCCYVLFPDLWVVAPSLWVPILILFGLLLIIIWLTCCPKWGLLVLVCLFGVCIWCTGLCFVVHVFLLVLLLWFVRFVFGLPQLLAVFDCWLVFCGTKLARFALLWVVFAFVFWVWVLDLLCTFGFYACCTF